MRLIRPGSICGPQQQFLVEIEETLFYEGDMFINAKKTISESENCDIGGRILLRNLLAPKSKKITENTIIKKIIYSRKDMDIK